MTTLLSNPSVGAICDECAKANGAVWPENHLATFWIAICDVCGKQPPVGQGVCDVSDWNWPKCKRPASFDINRRD